MSFYYKKGPLESTIPWTYPTRKLFSAWLKDFLSLKYIDNYEIWLCGGFLQQKWSSWDIDIVINGPVILDRLEKILIDGHYIGLYKYNLQLDIQHHNKKLIWPFREVTAVKKIVIYDRIIKNNEIITNLHSYKSLRQISNNLWEYTKNEPSDKQLERIKEYTIPPKRLYPR